MTPTEWTLIVTPLLIGLLFAAKIYSIIKSKPHKVRIRFLGMHVIIVYRYPTRDERDSSIFDED